MKKLTKLINLEITTISCIFFLINNMIMAQLFKTNDVISKCIIKTLVIKYGIYANMFAEKMWVASAKIPLN